MCVLGLFGVAAERGVFFCSYDGQSTGMDWRYISEGSQIMCLMVMWWMSWCSLDFHGFRMLSEAVKCQYTWSGDSHTLGS